MIHKLKLHVYKGYKRNLIISTVNSISKQQIENEPAGKTQQAFEFNIHSYLNYACFYRSNCTVTIHMKIKHWKQPSMEKKKKKNYSDNQGVQETKASGQMRIPYLKKSETEAKIELFSHHLS